MEISIAAEKLFSIGSFPVTNAFLIGFLVSVFLILLMQVVVRKMVLVPRGAQNVLETVFEGLLSLIESVLGNKAQSRRAFPLIATIFLFVLVSNWVGLLPGAGTIGLSHLKDGQATIVPFLRSTSADLNFTIALSIIVVLIIQVSGIAALGIVKYGKKFFISPFHKPYGLGTIMGLLELVSEFAKLLSFSFRLFGNIFAGEILLIVMLHLVPYFIPLPFLFLEVFVGFIQAAVFAMLTLVFLKMAMMEAAH
ncbi:MAG: ATP synthase F0 subunit A [Candidatus Moranbacteria bacterium RIFCSPLOWO2_02_FULL_48_19]|nr:MAG: ATP synthase F0 subunit A [Candidatus Moranbacteria bacterium RIFCSPLOWO2_02_FULL_48_19]